MEAIYALIPAALLVGTILSGPVEARGTADFGISKQDYFKVMNAKRLGKINKVRSLKAHKKAVAAGKATKKVLKTGGLKPRKKLAKVAVADKKPKTISVATPKQDKIESHKTARLEPAPMSKVLRSGPREVKNIMLGESLQVSGAGEVRKTVPVTTSKQDEIEPHKIARLEPASMSKVLRSGPREVKDIRLGEALQVGEASEVRKIVSVAASNQNEIKPRKIARLEVKNIVLGEASQDSEASEVRIAEIIREIAPSYGVPTWFALRIAEVESGYNPYARGRAGEIGVYQLKCQTARGMGFEGDCSSLTDAHTNVRWGLKHLSLAIALSGGNLRLAASKHNAGLGHKSLVNSYIAKVF